VSTGLEIFETKEETQLKQKDLIGLSRAQNVRGIEHFAPNEYYGLDLIFKHWLGISIGKPLFFAVPHGVEIGDSQNLNLFTGREAVPILVYNNEIGKSNLLNYEIPGWKVQGEHGFLILLHLLKMRDQLPHIGSARRGILFFPPHNSDTWRLEDTKFDEEICKILLEQYGSSTRVDISLPSASLRSGRSLIYGQHGFRVVSSGDFRDPKFLNRFVNLVSDYEKISTKSIGGHVFYASVMNKKVDWLGENMEDLFLTKVDDSGNQRTKTKIHPEILSVIKLLQSDMSIYQESKKILGENSVLDRERWLQLQDFGKLMDKLGFIIPGNHGWKPAIPSYLRRKVKDSHFFKTTFFGKSN
jgi:hypothetical protein